MNGKQLFGLSILSTLCISVGVSIGSSTSDTNVANAGVEPAQPTAVNICVDKKTGAMRLPPNGRCVKAKEILTPFAAGPQGVPGPAGASGPQGPMGLTGATGSVTGLQKKQISYYAPSFGFGRQFSECEWFGRPFITEVKYNAASTFYPVSISSTTETLKCQTATVYVP